MIISFSPCRSMPKLTGGNQVSQFMEHHLPQFLLLEDILRLPLLLHKCAQIDDYLRAIAKSLVFNVVGIVAMTDSIHAGRRKRRGWPDLSKILRSPWRILRSSRRSRHLDDPGPGVISNFRCVLLGTQENPATQMLINSYRFQGLCWQSPWRAGLDSLH